MKFLNKFIIILSSTLIISLGSAKAESLQEITQELNDLKESISNLGTSEVNELIVIDKALNEITKAVEFVNDKVNTGDIEAAVAALNFVDKTMSDIATSTIPKEFETEVVKKGEDFSAEKMSEIADVTNNLTSSQNIKKQKLVQDMLEANIKGLDTIAISKTLNEIGITTMSSDDFAEAISQAEQIRQRTNSSGQALKRARDISEELKDQERFGAIIGTSAGEVDLALRQVEAIREGDPRNFRAFEIEKYGKSLGLSVDSINKGIQAVYSGDIEAEKQVTLEIFNAAGVEIDDAAFNGFMAETIAKQNIVYAVMNNNELGFLDTSAFKDGVVVHDVSGYVDVQKQHKLTISEFANEVGNYMESIGSFDSDTIRDVKYQINYSYGVSGLSSKTVASLVMADLEGDEYKDAYWAIDRSWTDFEKRGSRTLAYTAARVEAIMMDDRYAHTAAASSDDYAIKLTDSQKAEVSRVYDNALEIINIQNASIALGEVKRTTKIATETAFQLTPKINSLETKIESLSSDKNYLALKAEVDEVNKYKEKLLKDRTEEIITKEEYWVKFTSVQAGNTHAYLAKKSEFTKLQSEIDAVKKTVSSTKRSIKNTKDAVNTATKNAAKVGVSIEAITQTVSSTAERVSVVAAKIGYETTTKAAKQAAEEAAKISQKNKQVAEQIAVKAAEQAAVKAAEAATAKAAQQASTAAATKAAEQAKAAAKAAEQAAAKALQAAQVAATKASQQAADAAAKASQQAAEAAAHQAAKAVAAAAQEEAQLAAQQAAAMVASQASQAHLAATYAAQQAAAAAQQAAQQAKEAVAQASQAAASEAAEAAATAAKQAAQQATQQLAATAIQAAKIEVAKSTYTASVAATAVADQAKKIADQYKNSSDPNTPSLIAIRKTAKETAEKATTAAALSTAAQEAVQGIARASNEGYSEAQIAIREAAVNALDEETKKAVEKVTQEATAQVTEEIKIATTEAAVDAAKIAFAEGQTMTEADKQALVNQIQGAISELKAETSIGMSYHDAAGKKRYEEIRDKWREKSIEDRTKDFDKLDELKDAKSKAQSIKTSD